MGARTSNFKHFYFLIEIHCTSRYMYICLLPQNQVLCQQVAIITMQLDHIAIHIPSLIRTERGSGCFWIRNSQEEMIERNLLIWNLSGKSGKISIYKYLKNIAHNAHNIVSCSFCKCQLTSYNKPLTTDCRIPVKP